MGNAHGTSSDHEHSGTDSGEELEDEAVFFDASHNGLDSIPDEAFDIPNLEKVMLQANQFQAVPEVRLGH